MSRLLQELKTRARLRLNAMRRGAADGPDATGDARLRDCLQAVSREVGFVHWEQARQVLGGQARAGDDQGSFWYAPACAALLNIWFAGYAEAVSARPLHRHAVLLPYRRQFVLAGNDFVRELGLDPDSPAWAEADRDLVRSAGSPAWEALAWNRLQASRPRTG